jgi:hypothetical protein
LLYRCSLTRLSGTSKRITDVSSSTAVIHPAATEWNLVSNTRPFHCSCGRTFIAHLAYILHKGNPLIYPPAFIDEYIRSGPLINEENFISNAINYLTNAQRAVHDLQHSVYCLVGVPMNVYKSTTAFNIRTFMKDCLQRKEPILVYIGKSTQGSGTLNYANYHTDGVEGAYSTVGKSIILETMAWFHVRSQRYRTLKDAEKAEVLAQVFVSWRSHSRTHEIKYKPGWFHMENQKFQAETTVDEKFGLLKMYKDFPNVDLFCTGCLNGTCSKSHDERTELFYGEPIVQLSLFSGNWNINQTELMPLRMR